MLLADDYAPIRIGIRAVLEEEGFDVCAEAPDADAAVAAAHAQRPDACVLDIRMPGDGVTAAARIAAELPETAVVMLTDSSETADVLRSLRAGACGYVVKDGDPARLGAALHAALRGDSAVPRELLARAIAAAAGPVAWRDDARLRALSEREWDVLQLLREGMSTKAIARRLYVAPVTVRSHVASILRKLGVADRDAAVLLLDDPAPLADEPKRTR